MGEMFWCGGRRWRCTDIGTRVVVAISLEPHEVVQLNTSRPVGDPLREERFMSDDPSWLNGPPYAIVEGVFDEYDQPGCSVAPDDRYWLR